MNSFEPIYLHDWADGGQEEMLSDFGVGPEALEGARVIIASYTYEDYSGDAYVLFERGGKLWEIHGGHCSCHGLSEMSYSGGSTQWDPEEADLASIKHRLDAGEWGSEGGVADSVRAALARLEA